MRLTRSAELSARAQQSIPGGVSSSLRLLDPPRVFVKASGSRVWDADGNEYLDYNNAFGPIILGHADPAVEARVHATLQQIDMIGIGATELEIELAEKVRSHVPSIEKILFTNSGSEATYHAIRLARAATGRRVIVKFQGCYHGWHDYTAANVISRPDRARRHRSDLGRDAARRDGESRRPALQRRGAARGHDDPARPRDRGRHPRTGHAHDRLRRPERGVRGRPRPDTARQGSVLIFDEVVTGFRHDLGGYQAICGIRPDLTTFAKAMANGYPIGAVGGRADLMDHFNTRPGGDVFFGGTYNAHALAMSAGLATIEALEADDRAIHRRIFALGEQMRLGLEAIVDRLGITARPTSFGSVWVLYFTDRVVRNYDDALTNDAELYVGFHRGLLERGFLVVPINLKRNHITAAHTAEDIARTLQASEDTLVELSRVRHRTGAQPAAVR